MKVLVLNMNKRTRYVALFMLIALLVFISAAIFHLDITEVFNSNRELPIYYVDCTEKKAAITFDCAWDANDIPDILNILEEEQVKATFFIVGQWADKHADMVRLISMKGHDIANHSQSHLRMGALSRDKIKSEISSCNIKLSEITGQKIDLFRAPYGDYSNNVTTTAKELGCYTIQWNVDSLDWKPGISGEEIINRISSKIVNGSILLFHNDTAHTVNVLPSIIKMLKTDGYELLPVSKLIYRGDYVIDFDGKQKKVE